MEALGIRLLAQTRAESAVAAIGLAVLASCFLLAVYRPKRTELEGTPHRVPLIAFMVALGWLVLAVGPSFDAVPVPEKKTLSLSELWMECVLQLGVIVIVASAYLFSRSPSLGGSPGPHPAENSDSSEALESPVPAGESPPSRGNLPTDWPHHLGVGITVGLATLLPTNLLGLVLAPERETGDTHILLRTLVGEGWDFLIPIILAAAVLAPVLEELLFRVIIQGWFADRVGKLAIPLTAGVFALIHRTSDAALLIPLALILGFLFEYRRSYLEVVAAHAAFNGANLFAAINAS
jgi:hypothetical protein